MSKKSNVETMGKAELRAACKAAGISYGKLTVEGMRDALKIPAAVNAVDGRSAPEDAEPVVTTVAQVASVEPAAPVAAPATDSPAVAPPAAAARVKAPKAPKVPAEARNGIQRPKDGGKCAEVWQALDALRAGGIDPSTKDVRDLATAKGWNVNNALCELSRWRRFNGVQKAQVIEAAAS